MLSKSITYIQGEPFKDKKYHTCLEENNDEQKVTFDQIQQYKIPYEQVRFYYDKEHCRGAGKFAGVHPGYIIQRAFDE